MHNLIPNVQKTMEQSFIAYIENSIKNNWDLDALTDYKGATLQYKDVARKIEKLHIIFEESGIRKGDKIAVCGRNSSHWGVTFLATLTYGAVIVPILHEFKADNVHNIVNHSEAKLLLVGDMVWETVSYTHLYRVFTSRRIGGSSGTQIQPDVRRTDATGSHCTCLGQQSGSNSCRRSDRKPR